MWTVSRRRRPPTPRLNPYFAPGAMTQLNGGLPVLDTGMRGFSDPLPPAGCGDSTLAELITKYGFRTEGRGVAVPPCKERGAHSGFGTLFPQVRAAR